MGGDEWVSVLASAHFCSGLSGHDEQKPQSGRLQFPQLSRSMCCSVQSFNFLTMSWLCSDLIWIYLFLITSEIEQLFITLLTILWKQYINILFSFIFDWFLIYKNWCCIPVTNPPSVVTYIAALFTMSFVIWIISILMYSNGSLSSCDLSF